MRSAPLPQMLDSRLWAGRGQPRSPKREEGLKPEQAVWQLVYRRH